MLALTGKRKLNLGSRDRQIPGFLGMDIDSGIPGVDIVGDIADLSRFANGEIAEIYASHVLEHFPHARTPEVLKEWARVLEPGGILYVAVPDFKRTVEIYEKVGLDEWIVRYLMGDQEYEKAYHYNLFDEERLVGLLTDAGFCDAVRVEEFAIGHPDDCSRKVSNYDRESVSLNMIAVRGDA